MKKQAPGYTPAYAYGYSTTRNGQSRNSGNLPSIFNNPGGLILNRPTSGMKLDVRALHPGGGLFLPTSPRTRTRGRDAAGERLYSSDTTADRIRQAQQQKHHPAPRTSDGRLERRLNPLVGGGRAEVSGLSPTRRRPLPSATRREYSTLPPIGAEASECDTDSLVTDEEDSVFGHEEEDVGVVEGSESTTVFDDSASDTDTDDEVYYT